MLLDVYVYEHETGLQTYDTLDGLNRASPASMKAVLAGLTSSAKIRSPPIMLRPGTRRNSSRPARRKRKHRVSEDGPVLSGGERSRNESSVRTPSDNAFVPRLPLFRRHGTSKVSASAIKIFSSRLYCTRERPKIQHRSVRFVPHFTFFWLKLHSSLT